MRAEFPWPNPEMPTFFYAVYGSEEIGSSGTTYLNRAEAKLVDSLLTRFVEGGAAQADEIAVITPYKGQSTFLVNYLKQHGRLAQDRYEVSGHYTTTPRHSARVPVLHPPSSILNPPSIHSSFLSLSLSFYSHPLHAHSYTTQ